MINDVSVESDTMALEIRKTMGADLNNFSSRLNVSFEKSLAEAVVNSIHAGANSIDVQLLTSKSSFTAVKIIDNGEGFTTKNLDSFFKLHSDHKKIIGGKGVGRATWYRYFDNVYVESFFHEEDKQWKLHFNLPRNANESRITKENISFDKNKTTVELTSYHGDPLLGFNAASMKQFLLKELLVMLITKKEAGSKVSIAISVLDDGQCIESESITDSDLPDIKSTAKFSVPLLDRNYDFSLLCIHASFPTKNSVITGFIAGERTISNFEAALGLKIQAPTNSYTGQYLFLLDSAFFNDNKYTTEGRDRVIFPDTLDLWGNNFKDTLKEKIICAVADFFDQEVPSHAEERKRVVNEIYDLYPQYLSPEYKEIIDGVLLETVGRVDRFEVLKKLNRHDFTKEYSFKTDLERLLSNKSIPDDVKDQTIDFAQKTTDQAKGVLANYFWYRKAIIDQLQKLREDHEKSEDVLHELFFNRYETQKQTSLKNCLWLLDDKFMSFSYFASEGIMRSVVNEIYGEHSGDHNSQKRMDLFIKFNRPSDSESIDCIVIEFKALGASIDERADAASQVRRKYASYLRKHIPNLNDIFVYIVSELDDELCEDMQRGDDFSIAYSRHGKIMTYYNKGNNAHIYFIGASTIVGDSKDRHELFFKLLKEELSEQERNS